MSRVEKSQNDRNLSEVSSNDTIKSKETSDKKLDQRSIKILKEIEEFKNMEEKYEEARLRAIEIKRYYI